MLEEKVLTDIEKKVLAVITLYNRPVTAKEVAEELDVTLRTIIAVIQKLISKGNVVKFESKEGGQFYTLVSSESGLDTIISQKYADMAGALEKQYNEIKEENEKLKVQMENLYANMLTLMGVFVAVFALIVINIDAIGIYVSKAESSVDLFYDLLNLNIPLLISITVMVLLIKVFLWKPNLRKKNRK